MAQKAQKQTARKNEAALNQLHLISLALNILFILYRFIYHYSSVTKTAIYSYVILNAPALGIQFYLETIGRPKNVRKAGEDVNSEGGMMEMLWDVIYVTWGCFVLVALFGEWFWWLWAIIPIYGTYAAYTTAMGMRDTLGGMGGSANDMAAPGSGSKRQAKMEKRTAEGKNVRYR